MKIALQRAKRHHWSGGIRLIDISHSLPYFQCAQGVYVHRVRYAQVASHGPRAWGAFTCWCGVTGYIGGQYLHRDGRLIAAPTTRDIVCATCEGRAIGTGLFGTPLIDGQPVRFAPRVEGEIRRRPARWEWMPPDPPQWRLDDGPEIDVPVYRRDTGERL